MRILGYLSANSRQFLVEDCFLGLLGASNVFCVWALHVLVVKKKKKKEKGPRRESSRSLLSRMRAKSRCMRMSSDDCRTWLRFHLKGEAFIVSKQSAQSIPLNTVTDLLFGHLSQAVYVRYVTPVPDFSWLLQVLTLHEIWRSRKPWKLLAAILGTRRRTIWA